MAYFAVPLVASNDVRDTSTINVSSQGQVLRPRAANTTEQSMFPGALTAFHMSQILGRTSREVKYLTSTATNTFVASLNA